MGRLWSLQIACSLSLLLMTSAEIRIRARKGRWRDGELHRQLHESGRSQNKCQDVTWEKLVVAARFKEDISWMSMYLTPWMPFLVCTLNGDPAATCQTFSNTGREAQAYLQFITDYYECLPKEVAFIHAHRSSPHSPDIVSELRDLRWGAIPGFLGLSRPQRMSTFYFGDPDKHKPSPGTDAELAHWMEFALQQNQVIKVAWPQLFKAELGPIPNELTSACCGQFVVTRERILSHPRSFYQGLLRWLRVSEMDSFWAGLIFEHTWSYIFGAGTNYTHPPDCKFSHCKDLAEINVKS